MPTRRVDLSDLKHALDTLDYVKLKRIELNELYDNARAEIEDALGDAEVGMLNGREVITWKTQTRRALNQRKLKEALPEIAEMFTETTEVRRFAPVEQQSEDLI